MAGIIRSLWEMLVAPGDSDRATAPTCDECFAILEYLADTAAAGGDSEALRQAARRHLTQCPNCREHHLRRLQELESELANSSPRDT